MECLRERDDSELCSIAINIVGNLAASVGESLNLYVPKQVEELFITLKMTTTPIALKPKAINALADIATYLPVAFRPYLGELLNFLGQASVTKINEGPVESEDWVNYIYELRDATLVAYSSCIYCVRDIESPNLTQGPSAHMLLAHEVIKILEFIYLVMGDPISSKSNIKNALMLTQDLVQHFKSNFVSHLQTLPLYTLLRDRCTQSNDQEIQCMSVELDEMITKLS
eukprot:Protomagalhaensia_wolfi_Nauph_80__2079@NODE_232_length_3101_cov_63_265186_g173_i0_p2_GENE_NODE_232_length_3101_cov_63_265186_g173_i0NODE_232_length_3101_cov_63_265186_g173_i0_p2_ORF_typecomplete_len227_score25_33Proteasom_PSMB/PF10508_9/0_073Proteasom_PSMB/PF10508_9/9_1e02CLASP_N/PF12348_8/1_6e03CLASP_N/PF12348_8/58CLASP_N/PF12348_8/6_7_NODE_232_length_3101_cov_63_265186_g173_i016852365